MKEGKDLKKKSTLSWVQEFAGRKKICFGGSVLLAILGVAASFIPYLGHSMSSAVSESSSAKSLNNN